MRPQLLRWQYDGYPEFHGNRLNLIIHIVAVPMFVGSLFNAIWSFAHLWVLNGALSLIGVAVAFGAQAVGHGREKNPAIPFAGPGDLVSRILAEQHITFWRFVFSGGFWRALFPK